MSALPRGATVRRDAGLYGYERALRRHGIDPIAGVDEAGRGACAGPLVAGACDPAAGQGRRSCPGSPTPSCSPRRPASAATPRSCAARSPGRSWSSSHEECDRLGMHVANVEALRRARRPARRARRRTCSPTGSPSTASACPGLAVWKGDRVAACIAAASVLAKVTRDRIMAELDAE